jgi:predicted RecA/RadA family phage recombinase
MTMRNDGLIKTFIAATAIARYSVVKLDSAEKSVALATAASDPLIGVLSNPRDMAQGSRVDVIFSGIAEVLAGGTLTKGAWVTVNTSGQVVAAAASDERIGRALEAANASGDIIAIEINKN